DDRYVHIRITDDGVGMPATVADHIFEPLYTTKGEQGTGMGLAVAAGVMREHGGFITVESEPGKGSTFTLAFPIMHEENDGVAVTDSLMTGAGAACVLVVDDEPMVRNVVERLLSLRGHTVISAGSGREALDLMKEREFDIVFTDQGMPEMSGRELAHHIARSYPDTPIVLLTGDTDLAVDPAEIREVLRKPFRAEDLAAAISQFA
ncbi:MAG: response regulator, partial [Rhodothermales bacterium]|nr:response regulator [Rhodothermales bacterium]